MSKEVNLIHTTDTTFEKEVLQASTPVLVDFWAEWCGPCLALGPIFKDVATQYEGKVLFAKMDVDDNVEIAPKYGVRGIPTIILFKDGNVVATKVGALSKKELIEFVDNHL